MENSKFSIFNTNMEEPAEPLHPVLSPCSSGRRLSHDSNNSPEFEFWNIVRNPSFPQPNLHSADELFSGGVLLPLHLLTAAQEPEPSGSGQAPEPEPEVAEVTSATPALTSSKRWRDIIFKKNDKKITQSSSNDHSANSVVKEKKREKKNGVVSGNNGVSAAELNINIWPFSRSRSAGNGGARPRPAAAGNRKVSSAPCSRSNSGGESKSRKWPSSPARAAGVHLGRSSPVWQVRRGGGGRNSEGVKKDVNEGRRKVPVVASGNGGSKPRVLSLNVPMCIGYRPHLSCKSDENSAVSIAAAAAGGGGGQSGGGGGAGEGVRGSNLFNIRSLFTKKVY